LPHQSPGFYQARHFASIPVRQKYGKSSVVHRQRAGRPGPYQHPVQLQAGRGRNQDRQRRRRKRILPHRNKAAVTAVGRTAAKTRISRVLPPKTPTDTGPRTPRMGIGPPTNTPSIFGSLLPQ